MLEPTLALKFVVLTTSTKKLPFPGADNHKNGENPRW